MDNNALSPTAEISNAPISGRKTPVERIFLNDHGLRAGWRLLIYFVMVFALQFLTLSVVRLVVHPARGVFSASLLTVQEFLSFAVVFGAALIMSRIEKRDPGVYGLPARSAFGKLFWQGWFVGLCEVTALIS